MSKAILTPAQVECRVVDPGLPFSLECFTCDAGMEIDSPEKALLAGWKNIEPSNGLAWNYLGDCPDCIRLEATP